jgi:nicotinamide-nucleotide amidase
MKAETIAVGSELLLGQIVNSNASIIAKALQEIGIDVYYHTCVGDNRDRIEGVFQTALERSDIIILTVGLGPTMDDLTKETISSFLRLPLKIDEPSLERMKKFFDTIGKVPTENNFKQTLIPEGSIAITNNKGTAPGVLIKYNNKIIVLLPGPPFEMEPMLVDTVIPYLLKLNNDIICSKVIKFHGIGESSLEEKLKDLLENQTNPTIASLAKKQEVTLRITAKAKNREAAFNMIEPIEREIKIRLGNYLYGYDDETIEGIVAEQLFIQKKTIAFAESCTGGLMSHRLTNIPGISESFKMGIVCYSNSAKMKLLRVNSDTLMEHGAVSEQTAKEMAEGIRIISGTDIGVSITGIAGPEGGTTERPVGLMYIGYADSNGVDVWKHTFAGERIDIKERSVNAALHKVRMKLLECR